MSELSGVSRERKGWRHAIRTDPRFQLTYMFFIFAILNSAFALLVLHEFWGNRGVIFFACAAGVLLPVPLLFLVHNRPVFLESLFDFQCCMPMLPGLSAAVVILMHRIDPLMAITLVGSLLFLAANFILIPRRWTVYWQQKVDDGDIDDKRMIVRIGRYGRNMEKLIREKSLEGKVLRGHKLSTAIGSFLVGIGMLLSEFFSTHDQRFFVVRFLLAFLTLMSAAGTAERTRKTITLWLGLRQRATSFRVEYVDDKTSYPFTYE